MSVPTEKFDALMATLEDHLGPSNVTPVGSLRRQLDAAVRTAALDWGEALLEEIRAHNYPASRTAGLLAELRAMRGGGGA